METEAVYVLKNCSSLLLEPIELALQLLALVRVDLLPLLSSHFSTWAMFAEKLSL